MPTPKPRRHLREEWFRKFEPFLARACKAETLSLPPDQLLGLSADTFVARFNDAKLGFTRYNYPSTTVSGPLSLIRAVALEDGGVIIRNTATLVGSSPPQAQPVVPIYCNANDRETVVALAVAIANGSKVGKHKIAVDAGSVPFVLSLQDRFDVVVEVDPNDNGFVYLR